MEQGRVGVGKRWQAVGVAADREADEQVVQAAAGQAVLGRTDRQTAHAEWRVENIAQAVIAG